MAASLVLVAASCVLGSARPGRAATQVFATSGTELSTFGPGTESSFRMAPGSTLSLETDANGDGVPGDVTVAASHFVFQGEFARGFFGSSGTFTVDLVAELQGGLGIGVFYPGSLDLVEIQWTQPASFLIYGTILCSGLSCPFAADTVWDYEILFASTNTQLLSSLDLGRWSVFQNYFQWEPTICDGSSCPPADPWLETALYPPPDQQVFQYMRLQGGPVPEPSALLLLLAVLPSFAIRRITSP